MMRISLYLTEIIYLKIYILERVDCITFFDVRTQLNNRIQQYPDIKCTYKTKPLKIDC